LIVAHVSTIVIIGTIVEQLIYIFLSTGADEDSYVQSDDVLDNKISMSDIDGLTIFKFYIHP
jgi:hypothetical protein